MEEINYITDEEREKCQKVAGAFAELYNLTDTIVVDAGKYGFVKLQYYQEPRGFEVMLTYTDSKKMFEDLWQDWFEEKIMLEVEGTPLEELEYEEIFARLSKEKQMEIMSKKSYFEEKSKMIPSPNYL